MKILFALLAATAFRAAAAREPPTGRDETCWALDGVSAIQVEVVQYVKTDPSTEHDSNASLAPESNATEMSEHNRTIAPEDSLQMKKINSPGLPPTIGHHVPYHQHQASDSQKAASQEIIHTRGHFNSVIVILIFTGLACVAIAGYCCVVIGAKASEEAAAEAQEGQKSQPEDTRLKDAMADREKRLSTTPQAGLLQASPRPADLERKTSKNLERQRSSLKRLSTMEASGVDTDTEDAISKSASLQDHSRRRRLSAHGRASGIFEEADLGGEIVKGERRYTWASTRKVWGEERWNPEESHESMSALAFVVNIVADLCPSGFLSIAYGMDGTGYIWSLVIMIIFYALCVYTMWCCGRTCEISGETDFASQWALVIGPGGSWIPLLVIVIVAFGALLCYACYFGDLLEEVMPALGLHVPRYACLISFSLFPALPLCLLKNLSALAYSSFFAFMALVYTAIVMCMRCGDGTYAEGGRFYAELEEELLPVIPEGNYLLKIGAKSLLFINILAMAFHCHCNACKYYRELKGTTPRHFRNCTIVAMGIAAVLYGVIGFVGFKTFGTASSGTILKNYSLEDMPVNVARFLISLSLVASYAIMFSALREAFIGMLKHVLHTRSFDLVWRQDVLSGVLVALVTVCGVVSKDSGLVDGFVGAFCGNAIIYIIPCLLYCATVKSFLDKRRNRPGLAFSSCLVLLGVLLAIAGCACLVLFEVEAAPERPVEHHWTHHHGHLPINGSKVHHRIMPERTDLNNASSPLGYRPAGRHIWAMR